MTFPHSSYEKRKGLWTIRKKKAAVYSAHCLDKTIIRIYLILFLSVRSFTVWVIYGITLKYSNYISTNFFLLLGCEEFGAFR